MSEIDDTRVRASAVHRDSIAVRREGAAQIALVGPPNVGKSSLLQALSEDPDEDRRLPVHDPAAGPRAHPHRRRAHPARRDPGADRGRVGGSWWRSSAPWRPAVGRCDRLLQPQRCRPGRARGRRGRDRRRRHRETGVACRDTVRRGRARRPTTTGGGFPRPRRHPGLDHRRGVARRLPDGRLAHDWPPPRPATQERHRRRRAARAPSGCDGHRRGRLGPSRSRHELHGRSGLGTSARFDGQRVGRDHVVADNDIVEIVS